MGQPGEQARIREVLIALGGSAEEFDRAREHHAAELSLESRLEAYSRITRLTETTAARPGRPAGPVVRRRRGPALVRALTTLVRAPVSLLLLLATLATRVAHAARAFAFLVVGAIVGAARSVRGAVHAVGQTIVQTVRSWGRFALRTVALVVRTLGAFARAVTGAAKAVARSLRPRPRRRRHRDQADDFSAAVVERVRAATGPTPLPTPELVNAEAWLEPEPPAVSAPAPPSVGAVATRPLARKRRRAPVLAILAAAVTAAVGATLVLAHGHGGGAPQANVQPAAPSGRPQHVAPAPVPSRAAYTDPRAYAAAMTRLALTTGQTELNGLPACRKDSTWNRWTCQAKGRPTIGAYAGHWLTYRCSPAYHPQPGGRPASLMINCRPVGPPSLTA